MHAGLHHYLFVSFMLFSLGLLGVIMRRNLLVIYMSLELMLNAANLALVSFSRFNNKLDGQVLVFFIITVAAAEVAVGLALIVALYRKRQIGARRRFDLDETSLTDEIRNSTLADFVPAAAVRGGDNAFHSAFQNRQQPHLHRRGGRRFRDVARFHQRQRLSIRAAKPPSTGCPSAD